MSKEVEIEALRPFKKTAAGDICEVGDRFDVTPVRAEQLERSGLAQRVKVAPAPSNKMARAPSNKMARAPSNKAASTPPAPTED